MLNIADQILLLVGLHFIADSALQDDFTKRNKGKRWISLFLHAVASATLVCIALMYFEVYATWKFITIIVTHMAIDKWKSNTPRDEAHFYCIYIDQGLHIVINTILLFM